MTSNLSHNTLILIMSLIPWPNRVVLWPEPSQTNHFTTLTMDEDIHSSVCDFWLVNQNRTRDMNCTQWKCEVVLSPRRVKRPVKGIVYCVWKWCESCDGLNSLKMSRHLSANEKVWINRLIYLNGGVYFEFSQVSKQLWKMLITVFHNPEWLLKMVSFVKMSSTQRPQILTFKKPELGNVWHSCMKKAWNY